MKRFLFPVMISLLFSACSPLWSGAVSTLVPIQQPLQTSTEVPEEVIVATEQARAATVHTQSALTMAAQPTFTPRPTFTPTSANLPALTPIPNSTPAGMGAFMDVPPDVLGSKYEIQNAYYFDRLEGRERYEIYAGAIAGFSDPDSAQGIVIVRVLRVEEKEAVPSVEVVATTEFLTTDEQFDVFPAGPVQINTNSVPETEEGNFLLVSISQGFSWIFVPTEPYLHINSFPPRARLEIGEQTQMAGVGGYCWLRSCASGGAISTSSTPLTVKSMAHLHLPMVHSPDNLTMSAMLVSPPGVLRTQPQYDGIQTDKISWFYGVSGRDIRELGSLALQREQDFNVTLEPGYYVLLVFAAWKDYGDVTFAFLIEVQE